jgi:tRNA(Arg) A34 adenosine deaminase TadA
MSEIAKFETNVCEELCRSLTNIFVCYASDEVPCGCALNNALKVEMASSSRDTGNQNYSHHAEMLCVADKVFSFKVNLFQFLMIID